LQNQNQQLEVSVKTNTYKVKEMEAMVATMMRYPDASLGQLMEEPGIYTK
jgi:hypothetical protein